MLKLSFGLTEPIHKGYIQSLSGSLSTGKLNIFQPGTILPNIVGIQRMNRYETLITEFMRTDLDGQMKVNVITSEDLQVTVKRKVEEKWEKFSDETENPALEQTAAYFLLVCIQYSALDPYLDLAFAGFRPYGVCLKY